MPDKFVVGYALDYNEYFRDLNVSVPDACWLALAGMLRRPGALTGFVFSSSTSASSAKRGRRSTRREALPAAAARFGRDPRGPFFFFIPSRLRSERLQWQTEP